MKKIVVMNFSGNVGKSTVARHLLAPRLGDAHVFAVESINSDGSKDEKVRGNQYRKLVEEVAMKGNAVVDVGASNVEDFINLMEQYEGSHEEFDHFVIPVVSKPKQQRDTIATIEALAKVGVSANRIRVIFNMLEPDESPENEFPNIFRYYSDMNKFTLYPLAVLRSNEIFGLIGPTGKTIKEILEDDTDFRQKRENASTPEERLKWLRLQSIQRLATGVTRQLDTVFASLF